MTYMQALLIVIGVIGVWKLIVRQSMADDVDIKTDIYDEDDTIESPHDDGSTEYYHSPVEIYQPENISDFSTNNSDK